MYFQLRYNYPMTADNTYYFIDDGIDFEGIDSWALGKLITQTPPNPIIVSITKIGDSDDPDLIPAPFIDAYMCLATPEIVSALQSAGVDNIQIFPAILKDTETNKEYKYYAVNIIGILKAADLDASEWVNFDGEAKMDTIFESLVIDKTKTRESYIFRLYEDTGTIIIHEKVKLALEKFEYLSFNPV
jgi:hypothetical protein